MQTIAVPLIQTKADQERAKKIRMAEERRRGTITPPDFIFEGGGACNDVANPDDFTNSETRGQDGWLARERAKTICRSCPFSQECLAWARKTMRTGVYGGLWLSAGVDSRRM